MLLTSPSSFPKENMQPTGGMKNVASQQSGDRPATDFIE